MQDQRFTHFCGKQDNVKIFVTGQACSAASIIAMAGHCSMTPTSLMMVHCVSTGARGNHSDMEHACGSVKNSG